MNDGVPSLTPALLLKAYSQGYFPMAEEDGAVYWYDPDPRAVLPLEALHVSRSLKRRMRRGDFSVRYDTAFRRVMEACAAPAPGRETTWISAEFIEDYTRLHELGWAHSVEVWMEGRLTGGLYGVAIGGFFAGESMFSHCTGASKIALVFCTRRLIQQGFRLFDVQFMTEHLRRFGVIEISREAYKAQLAQALRIKAEFLKTKSRNP